MAEGDNTYHALFTSHHLVSQSKRRSLQQWSSSLSIHGFAKIGYPGIIYAEGPHTKLDEFVANELEDVQVRETVKAIGMQCVGYAI